MSESAPQQGPRKYLTVQGTEFVLLGTAHISQASADEVAAEVASRAYDAVAVELCESRLRSLTDPNHLENLDLFQALRDGRGGLITANLALGAYQQRLAEQLGVEPGAELKIAAEQAQQYGAELVLIDREVGTTMRRLYRSVRWYQRLGLIGGLVASVASSQKIESEDVERLKRGDILESTFRDMAQESRSLYTPLIAERDRYMAARLLESCAGRFRKVLVVLGAGHLEGVAEALERPTADPQAERRDLDTCPPPSRWPKFLAWAVVAVVLSGFALGFAQSPELGWTLVATWVLLNGGLSALGAALAYGHPVTVAGAFFAAPLTSLNPTIGAGFVAAAIELTMRRPRVGDFRSLRKQLTRWQGWWVNRVARTLLVFLFASLGSAAGTYLAGARIVERLISA
ncbi:conjugal transfer protein TraB [Halorhodospira abdelmalekii]|uniref:TraB/GumN family protein n=1 Tax=Halorhodospira abdelmalekii TaxID=421629 RepID=UPI0019065703|nr:TraB/GumN family protein [Halorhodospira abdelmalekii]MBK1734579.1 conjugal transfer protein TraB [Halorhodospira abdelmalekii]